RRDRAECEREAARTARSIAAGEPVGLLAGLPYVAKDIFDTAGLRTTLGSPIFANRVPEADAPGVARLREAGALLIAKSNTPEFAAGSQTFNTVFGATRNPHDPSRTVGGSSGGAAAALAAGMAVVADGSDLAASLRNPASFCGVVGIRPTTRPDPTLADGPNAFDALSVAGPLGRSVDDCRLVHAAMFERPAHRPIGAWLDWLETRAARPEPRALRLAWSADLGGVPLAAPVRAAFLRAIDALRDAGVELVEAHPDFDGADESFMTLRGLYFVEWLGELYRDERARMKDTVVWNIEQGLALDAGRIAHAQRLRGRVFRSVAGFMRGVDAFLLPTAQVLPFPLDVPYPTSIDGVPLATYVDWLKTCYWISASGHPGLSIPCGRARDGDSAPLPVGLQLVGRWGGDAALFDVAETVESVLAPLVAPGAPVL
ncbi:MAG TPA: amidase family protein, partial [Burkholderiaceae bacterium]|nr:amidase family protein [Burkholderiaceae bacterium]